MKSERGKSLIDSALSIHGYTDRKDVTSCSTARACSIIGQIGCPRREMVSDLVRNPIAWFGKLDGRSPNADISLKLQLCFDSGRSAW